jgi:hypothetical protein
MGYRGHKKWDEIAITLIIIFLFTSIFSGEHNHITIFRILYLPSVLTLILLACIVFTSENIQKDPEIPKDFDDILKEIQNRTDT